MAVVAPTWGTPGVKVLCRFLSVTFNVTATRLSMHTLKLKHAMSPSALGTKRMSPLFFSMWSIPSRAMEDHTNSHYHKPWSSLPCPVLMYNAQNTRVLSTIHLWPLTGPE